MRRKGTGRRIDMRGLVVCLWECVYVCEWVGRWVDKVCSMGVYVA